MNTNYKYLVKWAHVHWTYFSLLNQQACIIEVAFTEGNAMHKLTCTWVFYFIPSVKFPYLFINIYYSNQQMVVKTSSAITMPYVKPMAREVLSVSVRPVVDK